MKLWLYESKANKPSIVFQPSAATETYFTKAAANLIGHNSCSIFTSFKRIHDHSLDKAV